MSATRFLVVAWLALVAVARAEPPAGAKCWWTFSELERRLFEDASDGRLDQCTLLEAALVASGVSDDRVLREYQADVDRLAAELRRLGTARGAARQKAQAVFEFMHRRVLTGGYALECTDLRQSLDHGRFNCVSASVLFNCLAERFGLDVVGLEIPGHAMSRLRLGGQKFDIETTCPRWFQLADDPKKQAELVEKTLGRLPNKDRRQTREVSPIELTAMIYYNRGVDLLGEKQFAEAAAANAKAVRLDPSNATARGNFLATLNNWAIDLGNAQRYAEAAELLRQGLAIEPGYETFSVNYVHLCRQWVDRLCVAGRFDQAIGVLAQAIAEQPRQASFREAQAEVYRRWAKALMDDGR